MDNDTDSNSLPPRKPGQSIVHIPTQEEIQAHQAGVQARQANAPSGQPVGIGGYVSPERREIAERRHAAYDQSNPSSVSVQSAQGIVEVRDSFTRGPKSVASAGPRDIVTIRKANGGEATMRLDDGIRAGYIDPSILGRPSSGPGAAAPKSIQQLPPKAPESGLDERSTASLQRTPLSNPALETSLSEIVTSTDPSDQIAFAHAVADNYGDEPPDPQLLNRMASTMGIHPDQLRDQYAAIRQGFETQAASAMRSELGSAAQPHEVVAWAKRHQPELLKRAMRDQMTARNPHGFKELAARYISSPEAMDPDRILHADFGNGITARRVGGHVILNIPGRGEITYQAAVQQGIIKVSRG